MNPATNKREWYKEWFGSPYYPLLYCSRDEKEAESLISLLIRTLELKSGMRILDLACGRGRHAVCLASKGFEVTGVDLSEENISEAQKQEGENLSFYVHDMRNIFRVNYFDVVLNLFTSFGYFESDRENLKVLHAAATALKPGGRLVLDYFNGHNAGKELVEFEEKKSGSVQFRIRRNIRNGFIEKEIHVNDGGKEFTFMERVKILTEEDFRDYFTQCGLKILHLYGSYSLDKFKYNKSERLILISQKPNL
jgi:SAM-dependent methyltransferase